METNETRKGKYSKKILKEKIYENEENKSRVKNKKKKTYNNEEKPCLKKNEVCLLSPNFKLASN